MNTQECASCHEVKPLTEFGPAAPMWRGLARCRPCNRRDRSVRKHGLDAEQKQMIADAQGGCRICGHDDPGPRGWALDHDRSCCPQDKSCPKCRRGVLCAWCNWVLGHAFDRPQILRAAADYLDAPRTCDWHKPIPCAPRLCPDRRMPEDGRDGQDELTQMGLRSE